MDYVEHSEKIPVGAEYDVIVCGGGVAGVAAAVSAARHGKSVLLLERTCLLGGLGTIGLINFFVCMDNGRGTYITRGLNTEFLDLSMKYGYDTVPSKWKDRDSSPESKGTQRYMTDYSANIFALALAELVDKEGITLYYDSIASEAIVTERGGKRHLEGVIVQSKSGRTYHKAKMFVDTTGDADILYRSGVPCIDGKNYYVYAAWKTSLKSCKKAVEAGDISKIYDRIYGGSINLHGDGQPDDVPLYVGTTVQEVSEYVLSNQRILLDKIKEDDRFSRDITLLPTMPQFRTTRCIKGGYVFSAERDAYIHHDDSIALLNDFERRDYLYEVPYRCLVNESCDNIITAGRSASGEGYGWDILRVIPSAILTGQAAGDAVAQAIDEGADINNIDIRTLQATLEAEDVLIHFDESLLPADMNTAGERAVREDHFE